MMKHVYIVMSKDYTPTPLMAFEDLDDAIEMSSAIHHFTIDDDETRMVISIPLIADNFKNANPFNK